MTHESRPPSPDGLGALLRDARERAGLDLATIAERTHVRKTYLQALEEEDLANLPEDVYARNFLRLYARTVGVDADDALARFAALRAEPRGRSTGVFRTEAGQRASAASGASDTGADVPSGAEPAAPPSAAQPPAARPPRPPRRAAGASGPSTGRAAAVARQVAPLIMTLVLAGALVGTAVWGFNQLLFRPDRTTAGDRAPSAEGAPQAGEPAGDAELPGLAAPALPGGDALPDEILLTIDSEPPGAEVSVDAFPLPGTTPIRDVPVTARAERTLRVVREGYLPYEATVDMTRDREIAVALEPDAPSASEDDAPAPQEGVVIEVREASWLEAYQSTTRGEGERLVYTTAQPGERFVFERPVYVHLGNAGGVDISVDGRPVDPLGSGGAVTGRAFPAP